MTGKDSTVLLGVTAEEITPKQNYNMVCAIVRWVHRTADATYTEAWDICRTLGLNIDDAVAYRQQQQRQVAGRQ